MQGLYHKLCTSASFKAQWNTFGIQSIGKSLPVGFYQYVTHEVFKELIKQEFPVSIEETETSLNPLTPEEEKALWYVAGYVYRKVHDKLQNDTSVEKISMTNSLKEMTTGDIDNASDNWLKLVDRGGLWHINDKVFAVFTIMEEHIRQHLSTLSSKPERHKTASCRWTIKER